MQAWALSNSLSRQDMAIAVGMHKSRVDQIIRDLTLADRAIRAQRALEQMRRHMPDELFQQLLREQPQLAAYEELGITPDELGILLGLTVVLVPLPYRQQPIRERHWLHASWRVLTWQSMSRRPIRWTVSER